MFLFQECPVLTDGPRQFLVGLVKAYRLLLSPVLGSGCRFEPTCSAYALDALQRHGALAGSYLTVRRLCRCHPWCSGGVDEVPQHPPAVFTRLLGRLASDPDPVSPSSEKKYPS
jgi:putative membrane protein insertion efficiency factor